MGGLLYVLAISIGIVATVLLVSGSIFAGVVTLAAAVIIGFGVEILDL